MERENKRLAAIISASEGGLPEAVRDDPLLTSTHLATASFVENKAA